MRLLIAEDEKDLNRIISKRLESEGYTVDRCYDGGEALDYLRTGEFDAVIMDIMMPVMSHSQVGRMYSKSGFMVKCFPRVNLLRTERGMGLGKEPPPYWGRTRLGLGC